MLAQNPLFARRRRPQNGVRSLASFNPVHQRQQDVMVGVVLGGQREIVADPKRSWAERRAAMIHAGHDEESIETIHGKFAHGFQCEVIGADSVSCRHELVVSTYVRQELPTPSIEISKLSREGRYLERVDLVPSEDVIQTEVAQIVVGILVDTIFPPIIRVRE